MIVYRRPQREEAHDIIVLMDTLVKVNFSMFPPAAIAYYLQPWTYEKLSARIDGNHDMLIAAFDQGKPVGIVSGTGPEGGVGTIVWLVVENSHQGKGIGRGLFTEATKAYSGMGAHKVKLTAPSQEAKAFYERCGMRTEGTHTNHWWNLDFTALGIDV